MTHIEPQSKRASKKHVKINTASVKTVNSLVQAGICVGIRLSEGAAYFKLWLWAGMQSKMKQWYLPGAPVNMMENKLIAIVIA